MTEFEAFMTGFPDLFQFYHFYKFKQLIKEEEDKKSDKKGDRQGRVTNVNVTHNKNEKDKETSTQVATDKINSI
jgi:hypothetical protein